MAASLRQGSWRGALTVAILATLMTGLSASATDQTDTTAATTDSSQQTANALSGSTDSGGIAYGEAVLGPQKHATGLTALGPDLFGEEVNTNTGGLSFSQTDLSLPGNNGLSVNVTRRLIVDVNRPEFYRHIQEPRCA